MHKALYCLIICLVIIFTNNQLIAEESIDNEKLKLLDAIRIGKDALIKINPEIWNRTLEIEADVVNSKWAKYIELNPFILKDPDIENITVKNLKYWAIYYSTKPKDIAPKAIWHGPEAFIFIDCNSNEIIKILLW